MKISQMLKRENFYLINDATLTNYFSTVFQKEIRFNTTSRNSQETQLFIYPTINAIVTANPSQEVKSFLYKEFSIYSNNILLKKLVSFYVALLLNTKGLLSSKSIAITPKIEGLGSLLIYPGNRRVRVFHFDKGFVDVILKDGFPPYFFEKEIEFRKKYLNFPFILPIVKHNTIWFREPIINGVSLARISNKKLREYIFSKIFLYLELLQEKFILYKKTIEYVETLLEKIYDKAKILEKKIKNFNFERDIGSFIHYLVEGFKMSFDIPIVLSHGDLQEGNIIMENGTSRIYIIDWETWGTRSIWYDPLVLIYRLRREKTFFDNLKCYISGDTNLNIFYKLNNDKILLGNSITERQQISRIFLLEDILWQIEETENFPEGIMGFGFKFYINPNTQNRVRDIL
jgi:hypothetical protein